MAQGNIPNYQGALGAADIIDSGFDRYIKVYNDLGSAVTNGDVYVLDWAKDADSLDPSVRPTLVAVATEGTVYKYIVVVNNAPLGASTIADQAYGYVQVRGYCPDIKCTTETQANDVYIKGTNATQAATGESTTRTAYSIGQMLTAAVSSHGPCLLFGDRVLVG